MRTRLAHQSGVSSLLQKRHGATFVDWKNFASKGFIAHDERRAAPYWPKEIVESHALPGGRLQAFVKAVKSDQDGALEAQIVLATPDGHKLFCFNEEEVGELEKLAPRLTDYLSLWEEKRVEEEEGLRDMEIGSELERRVRATLTE